MPSPLGVAHGEVHQRDIIGGDEEALARAGLLGEVEHGLGSRRRRAA
jgi:hypothetical protein